MSNLDWREVDRALRSIALRRGALDAEEARWLREAERLHIWRHLGMVNALDYLERVLGYTPHAAQERLRVARALEDLPALTTAFASGELPFSAIRELTRVATPSTEDAWKEHALGKNVRQIEELVAGHQRGDPFHTSCAASTAARTIHPIFVCSAPRATWLCTAAPSRSRRSRMFGGQTRSHVGASRSSNRPRGRRTVSTKASPARRHVMPWLGSAGSRRSHVRRWTKRALTWEHARRSTY